eukprot:gene40839-49811_t
MERRLQSCLNSGSRLLCFDLAASLFALDKDAGVLSHPNPRSPSSSSNKSNCVIKGNYNFQYEHYNSSLDGQLCKTWLLHRLDKDTSGVLLVASDQQVAKEVKNLFKKRKVVKEYVAVVVGKPICKRNSIWEDRYEKCSGQEGVVRATSGNWSNTQTAVSQVTIDLYLPHLNLSVLRMRPVTGFAHQLRFQCARRNVPILGDEVYGDFQANRRIFQALKLNYSKFLDRKMADYKRMYLHAFSVEIDVDWHKERENGPRKFTAVSPLPAAFEWIKQA